MKNLLLFFAALIMTVAIASCSKDHTNPSKSLHTYVIVPGAWQGPYAWVTMKADLEKTGQTVVVIELPGHGTDQTLPQNIDLSLYNQKVINTINSLPGKVILVGHSLGGIVISSVAEKIPAKIERLVYIGAFLPKSGQSVFDLASTDANSILGQSLIPSQYTLDLIPSKLIDIFIQDGTTDEKALVVNNYRAEPGRPFTDTVHLTQANYGSVPKSYIHTLQDHAVTIDLQNRMVAAAGLTSVLQINTGHCPFLVKPDSLTTLLLKLSN